jgi:diaminopropionate ammonia-lyase
VADTVYSKALRFDAGSRILCFATEGVTDRFVYDEILRSRQR